MIIPLSDFTFISLFLSCVLLIFFLYIFFFANSNRSIKRIQNKKNYKLKKEITKKWIYVYENDGLVLSEGSMECLLDYKECSFRKKKLFKRKKSIMVNLFFIPFVFYVYSIWTRPVNTNEIFNSSCFTLSSSELIQNIQHGKN